MNPADLSLRVEPPAASVVRVLRELADSPAGLDNSRDSMLSKMVALSPLWRTNVLSPASFSELTSRSPPYS